MGFIKRIFGWKNRTEHDVEAKIEDAEAVQSSFRHYGQPPAVERHGRKPSVIRLDDESSMRQMGEDVGIQVVEDKAEEHLHLGRKLKGQGLLQEALLEYRAALMLEPDYVDAYHSIALLEAERGDYGAAYREFRRTLALSEQFVPKKGRRAFIEAVVANVCSIMRKQGVTKDSIGKFMGLMKAMTDPPPMYHCALGLLHEELGQSAQAEEEYRELLRSESSGQWAELARGKLR